MSPQQSSEISQESFTSKLKDNKAYIVSGLLGISGISALYSFRRRKLHSKLQSFNQRPVILKNKAQIRPKIDSDSFYWALSALGYATVIVFGGFGFLGLGISHYLEVKSLKELSLRIRSSVNKSAPGTELLETSNFKDD